MKAAPYDRGMEAGRHGRQAESFEVEKGIPPRACTEIGRAILEAVEEAPGALLEIGTATGEIGAVLAASGRAYAGLDASRAMLGRFAARASARLPLVESDAAGPWPFRAASAALVFGARVFHLLDAAHVAREARRVLSSNGVLLAGRVGRGTEDRREILRRSLAEGLARRGVRRRDSREGAAEPFEALLAFGAVLLPPLVVARWTVSRRPAASLETWRRRAGLPGAPELDDASKQAVLAEVEAAFRAALGDPDAPVDSAEWFELRGARLS